MLLAGALATVPSAGSLTRPPDAVVVLGGGGGERLTLGRDLAVRHDAELVVAGEAIELAATRGLHCDEAITCLEPEPWNTAGEARGTAELATDAGWEHIAVATSEFHVPRSRQLFTQCLDERVEVVGATSAAGPATTVWRRAREAVARAVGATLARAC